MWPALAPLVATLLTLYPFRHGRKRLVRAAARLAGGPLLWTTADGTRLLLDLANYIDREVVTRGGYERDAIDRMVHECAGCDAFLDIGANIGLYAIAVARATKAAVVAFEPDPRNLGQLHANLFLNALEGRVEARGEAVGRTPGAGTLHLQRRAGDLSTALSSMAEARARSRPHRVGVVALDALFDWRGRRLAIKMDIEGFETEALAGMTALLANNSIFLQVEIAERNLQEVRALLAGCGLEELPRAGDYLFRTKR